MSEIEVGEYIRTKNGLIFKATEYWLSELTKEIKEGIKSHSKNIIDLIEEGDYVNGYKVDSIENGKLIIGDTTQVVEQILENNKDIKAILTHEQYEENCYKVGDIE